MLRRVIVCVLLMLLATRAGLAQKPSLPKATCQMFAGRWTGRWTGGFRNRFTVFPLSDKRAFVVYDWRQQVDQGFSRQVAFATFENNKLAFGSDIELTLVDFRRGRADAVGNFYVQRTAKLTRCATPEDCLNANLSLARPAQIAEEESGPFLDMSLYLAANHNVLLLAEKNLTPAQVAKLEATPCKLPIQSAATLKEVVQQMCDAAGLVFRIDGNLVRVKAK